MSRGKRRKMEKIFPSVQELVGKTEKWGTAGMADGRKQGAIRISAFCSLLAVFRGICGKKRDFS